ncbi:nicotinate-nucleotide adenylyltransferase [Radiobacillus deserti]|uniref:Probable nicotinate-nucleotide adenylyltransferase n=1 Tax=Radiobacillus deserti TaxID=2594883 RepID=A0A516KGZ5_9BACI|nr:nicotinate-nucleotide adenylyltransferase [Radiobacillus deserti]QDP40673.1 nicotinate-nucleotide adenylyltransferase [Radiobacillus deserti]
MKKVGLLGGTFDPPHNGHLLIAEEVRQALGLDEIWFIPSYEPPHKQQARTASKYRVEMVQAAVRDNEHFKVQLIEVNREGKSYSIDTVKQLVEEYPNVDFYFIIGADMVEYLPKWVQIDELFELIRFVGVKRKEYKLESNYPIIEVNIPEFAVSSSMIRQRLKNGLSVKYLVPNSVIECIKENRLYEEK